MALAAPTRAEQARPGDIARGEFNAATRDSVDRALAWLAVIAMLAANGLKTTDYELISLGGAPQRLAAVQKGGVAGVELGEPPEVEEALAVEVFADRGDRLVLRQYSPMHTLGGAVVLDPAGSVLRRSARVSNRRMIDGHRDGLNFVAHDKAAHHAHCAPITHIAHAHGLPTSANPTDANRRAQCPGGGVVPRRHRAKRSW